MATPYCNYDPGYSRKERRIAEDHGIDLDAPEQVRCDSCNKPFNPEFLNGAGDCHGCAAEIMREEALAFLTAPTMAGCLALMAPSADIARSIIRNAEAR